jgi:hexokinase
MLMIIHVVFMYEGLAVLINRINRPTVTVGVDGSLYRYHPRFGKNMEEGIKKLVNRNTRVSLRSSSTCLQSNTINIHV